jgi:hypothetical protein
MDICLLCLVLSGRSLCDELIARPEESYRLWCVVVCDLETSRICPPYIYDISTLRVKQFCCLVCVARTHTHLRARTHAHYRNQHLVS